MASYDENSHHPSDMRSQLAWLALAAVPVFAQGNYEVQVYGSDLVKPGNTMLEFHTNFTFQGEKQVVDGGYPTEHQFHESIEITHGFNEWFETGFYIFTSAGPGQGYGWVGDHIRPRIAVPERYKLPVGLSLSNEFGYQRAKYSPDTWTWEIRPIIDKKVDKWYLSFNPTFDKSFHGPEQPRGYQFSPNFKVSYDVTKVVTAGLEYYGALGPITGFDLLRDQQQQILPAIDLNLGEDWEFNIGVGVGVTHGTDHLLVKMIIGRRFGKKKAQGPEGGH
jgi:hypothetical protein